MSEDYVLAIDVGGTTIKSLLLTEAGQVLQQRRAPTPDRRHGPENAVQEILDEAKSASEWGFEVTRREPRAIAMVTLGLVDEAAGVARTSAALGWHDVPLRDLLTARTGLPSVLGQDLRAAARAEAALGLEPSFLFVAIGTGVGAAIVRERQVDAGVHGLAGEIGHVPVPPGRAGDGRPRLCGCGAHGCLETEASATALARSYRERTGQEVSAAEVARRAATGDPDAGVVWDDLVEALTTGLLTAAALLDPGPVVLGGGVALAGEQLLRPLRERLAERYRMSAPPTIGVSALGDRAAGLGAGLLGWQHLRGEVR
jgi:glucokinase